MRKFTILGWGVLISTLLIGTRVVATAATAAQTSKKPSDKSDWSETLNGVHVRLVAPQGTTYRESSLLPFIVEVQNNTELPMPYRSLWPTVRVFARDGEGKSLGIAYMGPELGDWTTRVGNLEAGKTSELKFTFQSLRFNRPLKANEKIELQVSAPTQQARPGKLPLEVNTPPMTLFIESPFPKRLIEADLAGDWQMDLACRVDVGLLGSQTVSVDARGNAMLVQNTQRNGKRVEGRYAIVLPPARLAKLAAGLRKIQLWKVDERSAGTAFPDEGLIHLSLVTPTGGSLSGIFASHNESEQPIVREARELIEALITDIETRTASKP